MIKWLGFFFFSHEAPSRHIYNELQGDSPKFQTAVNLLANYTIKKLDKHVRCGFFFHNIIQYMI